MDQDYDGLRSLSHRGKKLDNASSVSSAPASPKPSYEPVLSVGENHAQALSRKKGSIQDESEISYYKEIGLSGPNRNISVQ